MTFGEDLGWGSSVEESRQIMDRYVDLGGNFIDTANFYTKTHSEKIIGDHIGRHPARRDRLVIATKFSGNLYPGDPNGGGSGRKSIVGACENSLRRLQTDFIDLYWLHNWDVHTPIDETMAALHDLVRSGKVRYIGVSDTPAWKIVEANMLARLPVNSSSMRRSSGRLGARSRERPRATRIVKNFE
jgi:aryl-alcohol dehydrogenase-like predicted oxidoreductase